MPVIEIYHSPTCPYCRKARALLDAKGARYQVHSVLGRPAERRAGAHQRRERPCELDAMLADGEPDSA